MKMIYFHSPIGLSWHFPFRLRDGNTLVLTKTPFLVANFIFIIIYYYMHGDGKKVLKNGSGRVGGFWSMKIMGN